MVRSLRDVDLSMPTLKSTSIEVLIELKPMHGSFSCVFGNAMNATNMSNTDSPDEPCSSILRHAVDGIERENGIPLFRKLIVLEIQRDADESFQGCALYHSITR